MQKTNLKMSVAKQTILSRPRCAHLQHFYRLKMSPFAGLVHISENSKHDDVTKWKHFSRHWPVLREIHRSIVRLVTCDAIVPIMTSLQ